MADFKNDHTLRDGFVDLLGSNGSFKRRSETFGYPYNESATMLDSFGQGFIAVSAAGDLADFAGDKKDGFVDSTRISG